MTRVALGAVVLFTLAASAPPAAAGVAILVEYVDVPASAASEFEAALTGPVRVASAARLEAGEIFAWYHYRSRFPIGTASDYTDVIVTVFREFASLESADVSAGYLPWIHDSEIFQGVPGIHSADYYGKVAYSYITVDFLTRGGFGDDAFRDRVREEHMPRLQQRADADEVVNWALFARRLPVTRDKGYEYALVSRFDSFEPISEAQITGPDADVHLVETAVWDLIDIVE